MVYDDDTIWTKIIAQRAGVKPISISELESISAEKLLKLINSKRK